MAKIELNNQQLQLIQKALDFYIRVGIGQFTVIKDHPTFERYLDNFCRPQKTPEAGDRTPQGEILEIKNGKALINGSVKDGMWCKDKKWIKLKDVVLSTDYSLYHAIREEADNILTDGRNELIKDFSVGKNGSWGIYNPNVDKSCVEAFDLIQIIRHEFWKKRGKNDYGVDAYLYLKGCGNVKVEVDD